MWRKITMIDLTATISQAEIDAYSRSSADDGSDPVPVLIDRTAEMVRGYIRANTAVRMSPESFSVPDSLISPACDYVAYEIIKRFPTKITEPRQKARDAAVALFKDLASAKFTPESFAAEGEQPANPRQSPTYTNAPRIL